MFDYCIHITIPTEAWELYKNPVTIDTSVSSHLKISFQLKAAKSVQDEGWKQENYTYCLSLMRSRGQTIWIIRADFEGFDEFGMFYDDIERIMLTNVAQDCFRNISTRLSLSPELVSFLRNIRSYSGEVILRMTNGPTRYRDDILWINENLQLPNIPYTRHGEIYRTLQNLWGLRFDCIKRPGFDEIDYSGVVMHMTILIDMYDFLAREPFKPNAKSTIMVDEYLSGIQFRTNQESWTLTIGHDCYGRHIMIDHEHPDWHNMIRRRESIQKSFTLLVQKVKKEHPGIVFSFNITPEAEERIKAHPSFRIVPANTENEFDSGTLSISPGSNVITPGMTGYDELIDSRLLIELDMLI